MGERACQVMWRQMTDVETGAFRAPPSLHWCSVSFANKSPKAWPKDQLVLGDAGLQVSLLVQGMGLQHLLKSTGTSPCPPNPTPTPPHDGMWLPGNPHHPSLFR